jgi:hypothetical protein
VLHFAHQAINCYVGDYLYFWSKDRLNEWRQYIPTVPAMFPSLQSIVLDMRTTGQFSPTVHALRLLFNRSELEVVYTEWSWTLKLTLSFLETRSDSLHWA